MLTMLHFHQRIFWISPVELNRHRTFVQPHINFTMQLIDVTTKYQLIQMPCSIVHKNLSYAVTTVNHQLILHIDQITTNYICGKLTGKQPIMACRHHSLRSCCCHPAVPSSGRAFLASVESATNDLVMVSWGQTTIFLLGSFSRKSSLRIKGYRYRQKKKNMIFYNTCMVHSGFTF